MRPATKSVCPSCGGKGEVLDKKSDDKEVKKKCDRCQGLGWVVPTGYQTK